MSPKGFNEEKTMKIEERCKGRRCHIIQPMGALDSGCLVVSEATAAQNLKFHRKHSFPGYSL